MELVNPTLYFSDLFYLTGSHKCALFLGQLLYWNDHKGKLGRIAKTAKEWETEIQLTVPDVTVCHKICVELGFIEIESRKFNNVTKSHYTVHKELILNCCKMIKVRSISESKKLRASIIESRKNLDTSLKEIKSPASKKVGVLITETITETITDITSTEINSVVPQLFKSELMQQALEAGIIKNQSAPSKPKKVKEPTDELTAEIHKYSQLSYDFFKEWYEKNHDTVLLDRDIDFINLKKTFRKLIKNSALKDEGKRFTPEKCYNGVKYIIENFSLLGSYHRNNISLNHIATNWNVIINEIKDKKNKPTNNSQGQPVQAIKTEPVNPDTTRERYMGRLLPYGTTYPSYSDLARAIFNHKKETEGYQTNLSISQWKWDVLYPEIKDYSLEQINQLKKKYNV